MLRYTAKRIMELLNEMPEVIGCELYGSIAEGTYDELSDIDINVDVSGHDHGIFMLTLAKRMGEKIRVYYSDYAPSLVPEKYIVSMAINEEKPTCVVDVCCCASECRSAVTRQQVRALNDPFSHMLKLWTANWKHYVRGRECREDILRMAGKIGIANPEEKDEAQILEETLKWLEENKPEEMGQFIRSCRKIFEQA